MQFTLDNKKERLFKMSASNDQTKNQITVVECICARLGRPIARLHEKPEARLVQCEVHRDATWYRPDAHGKTWKQPPPHELQELLRKYTLIRL